MKQSIIILLSILLICVSGFATENARLLRTPDINGNLVVFTYAGDIWSAPASGGDARRLTSHPGMEIFPRISPDGRWIAFSAEYSGSRQVYVIPADGGSPRQLTFYNDAGIMPPRGGYDHVVMDWTPDSRKIMVRCNRTPYGRRMGKYFLVSLEGGLETPLPVPEAGFGSLSPAGDQIVYSPICREFRTWKRTKGGRAQDIWIYNLKADTSQRLTTFAGTDQHPFWFKNKIYFVSDRDLTLNVYCYDLSTRAITQVTRHREFDVLWPSGSNGRLVYENGGYIYLLDTATGKTSQIKISISFDSPNRLPVFKNVSAFVSSFGYAISPTGKRAVFDARGDIFTVPAKEGLTYNLTRSQGIRDMFPAWSPDGRWISCISDRTGDYEIFLLDPQNKKKPLQLTTNHGVWKYPPVWSPDSSKLLFADKNQKLQILDIASKTITVADTGTISPISDYCWSPDSSWIVYSKTCENYLTEIWIYSLTDKKTRPLVKNGYDNYSPVFSADGKHLFFVSSRDFNMDFSSFEFDFVYNKAARLYAVSLAATTPALFVKSNDRELPAAAETAKAKKNKKSKKVRNILKIDFSGINERTRCFPLKNGDYRNLHALKGQLLYRRDRGYFIFNLKDKKEKPLISGIRQPVFSADGKKMLYKSGKSYGITAIAPNIKAGTGRLDLSGVTMKLDPVKEWKQIFNEGWRIFRDWFYVKNMHGVDWKKMHAKYLPLVRHLAHRADLDYIFGELVGELNAGHTYVNWGDFPRVKRIETGLLGAELEADVKANRFQIKKIYAGENWSGDFRSPLTENNVRIHTGDYIISLNGAELFAEDNPYRLLENTADRRIEISVSATPDKKNLRTYLISPLASEQNLKYLDWVRQRQQMVDRLSNGKIGYIHVPDTAISGNRELFKGMYSQQNRAALIIDDRYNGGGWSPGKMIELLSRKTASYWHRRNLRLRPEPVYAFDGPKVMLINHYSSSGGDNFPYWFKKNNLGKLIGTRTWGGLIGYSWSPRLVDGPGFAVPSSGIVGTDGQWAVEGVGIYPDMEVYDRPELVAAGKDPCLEAAVRHLLKELKKNPPKKITTPAEPDRSGWFEKKIK